MTFTPPYPPYDPTDKTGFSYETVIKRWPIILTGVVDTVHGACHTLALEVKDLAAEDPRQEAVKTQIEEGKELIEKISKLKYEMARDRALEPIPDDGEPGVQMYNEELKALENYKRNTWFTAPWLYAECYLYRLLRAWTVTAKSWASYDPFHDQKIQTFQHSADAVLKIATTIHKLDEAEVKPDAAGLKVIFNEMIQMCLWGNATDLSLLTHLSQDDIKNLQSVGREAQLARQKFILKDDEEKVWTHLSSLSGGRVDFVLDNSGFEFFTDLVFADFLVTHTSHVNKVVFHPKLIPWFVSDVTPPDFTETFKLLLDAENFFTEIPPDDEGFAHLRSMVTRWKQYLDEGVFALSVPVDTQLGGGSNLQQGGPVEAAAFWTSGKPYWNLKEDSPTLFESLKTSSLVIFKGDLNYRKLTGDIKWPSWTPFEEAVGPLAGSFALLSLRTNKADVVTGVDREVVEKLDASGEKWRVDGRYALVSFINKS